MKLKFIFLYWFIFFNSNFFGQNLDCKKFMNGSFKIVDSETGTSYINRYGSRQSEITQGKKDSTTYIVKWIDDCTYILSPTKETFKVYPFLPKNATLIIKIVKTSDTSYTQTSTSNFYEMKVTNEVIRVH